MATHNISGKVNMPAVPPLFSYQKGFFVVNNFYDLMTALSSTETPYKTIFAPTSINMTDYSGTCVDLRGINVFPVGLALEFTEDCTIIFNQIAGNSPQIVTYDGLGLVLAGVGGTRNVSLFAQTDTSMSILAKDLVKVAVNLTLNAGVGFTFNAEQYANYGGTLTGTIGYKNFTTTQDATPSRTGLMSASDKGRLDNIYYQVRKYATKVVGNTAAGHTTDICDYVCDGTADEVQINAALNALADTGGTVLLLEGTYNIAAPILLSKTYTKLCGVGEATVLKRMWNDTVLHGVVELDNNYCTVCDLMIDGNRSVYTAVYNCGVYTASAEFCTVRNIRAMNCYYGLYLIIFTSTITECVTKNCDTGLYYKNGYDCVVTDNNFVGSSTGGYINGSEDSVISSNNFVGSSTYGLYLDGAGEIIAIGNSCGSNGACLKLNGAYNCQIIGNTCNGGSAAGIHLVGSDSNMVSGNWCSKMSYDANKHTIRLESTLNTKNVICNNDCYGKAPTVEGGTENNVYGNKVGSSLDVSTRFTFTATLASATWVGASAPFTYTLTLSGILATDKPHISVDFSATLATARLEKAAYACIDEVEATADNTIVFRCFETKPTQALNIFVEVLRNG